MSRINNLSFYLRELEKVEKHAKDVDKGNHQDKTKINEIENKQQNGEKSVELKDGMLERLTKLINF